MALQFEKYILYTSKTNQSFHKIGVPSPDCGLSIEKIMEKDCPPPDEENPEGYYPSIILAEDLQKMIDEGLIK